MLTTLELAILLPVSILRALDLCALTEAVVCSKREGFL
jgi:hypothetical protein